MVSVGVQGILLGMGEGVQGLRGYQFVSDHVCHFRPGLYTLCHMPGIGSYQRATYAQLLHTCNMLQRKKWTAHDLLAVRGEIVRTLCMVELYLPCTELDAKLHMLLHMPAKIMATGPLWVTSMWVYEAMWARLLGWARNLAYPEVSMMRGYNEFLAAHYEFWGEPKGFAAKEAQEFSSKFRDETAARYQIPRGLASTDTTCKMLGVGTSRRLDSQGRSALHVYYQGWDETYMEVWVWYLSAYANSKTAAQRRDWGMTRNRSTGQWEVTSTHLRNLLDEWPRFVRFLDGEDAPMVRSISQRASCGAVLLYDECLVEGLSFTAQSHVKGKERSWVVLGPGALPDAVQEEGGLFLGHIKEVFGHVDYEGSERQLVRLNVYVSRDPVTSTKPELHPVIRTPVFELKVVKVGNLDSVVLPLEKLMPIRLCVVDHPSRRGWKVALLRGIDVLERHLQTIC